MILVDSSCWIEFFTDGRLAGSVEPHLKPPREVLTPTVVLYEVYKIVRRKRSEEQALIAAAQLQKTNIVPLAAPIALSAADISLEHGLAMADAIVYATARARGVRLLTMDTGFESLPGVILLRKSSRG